MKVILKSNFIQHNCARLYWSAGAAVIKHSKNLEYYWRQSNLSSDLFWIDIHLSPDTDLSHIFSIFLNFQHISGSVDHSESNTIILQDPHNLPCQIPSIFQTGIVVTVPGTRWDTFYGQFLRPSLPVQHTSWLLPLVWQ